MSLRCYFLLTYTASPNKILICLILERPMYQLSEHAWFNSFLVKEGVILTRIKTSLGLLLVPPGKSVSKQILTFNR